MGNTISDPIPGMGMESITFDPIAGTDMANITSDPTAGNLTDGVISTGAVSVVLSVVNMEKLGEEDGRKCGVRYQGI